MSVIYTGDKVILRPITMEDCTETYVGWLNDPKVNRYLETRHERQTLDSITKYVHRATLSIDTHMFAIIECATGTHIGNIKIGNVNPHHKSADISYFIGSRAHWGKGMATEAIRHATGFAILALGIFSVRAGVYGRNIASRRALEKNGYKLRGVLPLELVGVSGPDDHVYYGCRDDHVYYSITLPEYKP